MKKVIGNILKIGIPLAFGVYIILNQYNSLQEHEIETIKQSFRDANYFWVLASVVFGTLSHLSRAYRWRYTLNPLGIKIRFINSFFAVMIGYVANLVFPRLGEVSRCAVITKYENQPFEKLFGTVLAERVADMVILLCIILLVVLMQMDILKSALLDLLANSEDPSSGIIKLIIVGTIGLGLLIGGFLLIRASNHPLALKIKNLLGGLTDGILSIIKMDKKWAFIGHTIFIWIMYLLMFYVVFLALPDTSNVSVVGVLASFVVGGLSIILVQGGIGVYPKGVAIVLGYYGLTQTSGIALGWIIWTGQTAMLIGWGAISLIAMPLINSKISKKTV